MPDEKSMFEKSDPVTLKLLCPEDFIRIRNIKNTHENEISYAITMLGQELNCHKGFQPIVPVCASAYFKVVLVYNCFAAK